MKWTYIAVIVAGVAPVILGTAPRTHTPEAGR
jgi:hypothetical protein